MPTPRLFLVLAIAALLAAASVAEPRLGIAAVVLDVAVLAAWAIDLTRARRTGLAARRELPVLLAQGAAAEVAVEVTNRSSRRVAVDLREALHPGLAEGPLRQRLLLAPRSTATWRYELRPRRRGEHAWGPLTARVAGPWGLARAQRDLLPETPVRVYPRVRWGGRVGTLLALAHRHELGQSPWRVRGPGGGEPYGLRAYLPGDPPNRIHWRATARHGRLVTREESWEQGAHLVILLDCGRAMAPVEGDRSKLDHALAATLALARLAVGRGDRVSVVAFADRLERRARLAQRGTAAVRAAYATLYDLEARLAESDYELAVEEAFRLEPRRAVAVLVTSVTDLVVAERLQRATLLLERRTRTLLVNLEDPQVAALAETAPITPVDAIAKVAAMEILLANRHLTRRLCRAGVAAVTTPADRLALETLDAYLRMVG